MSVVLCQIAQALQPLHMGDEHELAPWPSLQHCTCCVLIDDCSPALEVSWQHGVLHVEHNHGFSWVAWLYRTTHTSSVSHCHHCIISVVMTMSSMQSSIYHHYSQHHYSHHCYSSNDVFTFMIIIYRQVANTGIMLSSIQSSTCHHSPIQSSIPVVIIMTPIQSSSHHQYSHYHIINTVIIVSLQYGNHHILPYYYRRLDISSGHHQKASSHHDYLYITTTTHVIIMINITSIHRNVFTV